MSRKTHYGMSAETIAARAPFISVYKELPRGGFDRATGRWSDIHLEYGWVVLDKSGDKIFPPTDVGAQSLCNSCVEELNLVAAKWLMEHEGAPIDVAKEAWEEINRYRK